MEEIGRLGGGFAIARKSGSNYVPLLGDDLIDSLQSTGHILSNEILASFLYTHDRAVAISEGIPLDSHISTLSQESLQNITF